MTLDEERVRRRGYFNPERVRELVSRMEGREFIYLKQVGRRFSLGNVQVKMPLVPLIPRCSIF